MASALNRRRFWHRGRPEVVGTSEIFLGNQAQIVLDDLFPGGTVTARAEPFILFILPSRCSTCG